MSTDELPEPESSNDAVVSLVAGIAGMIFVMASGDLPFLQFLGLVGGVIGMVSGIRVLRGAAPNKKLAVTGTITGTIAVALWVIIWVWRAIAFVWHLF
jgi:hypothetical protein